MVNLQRKIPSRLKEWNDESLKEFDFHASEDPNRFSKKNLQITIRIIVRNVNEKKLQHWKLYSFMLNSLKLGNFIFNSPHGYDT